MNGLTARLAIDLLNLPAGETIAVTGAAGAVGGYAVQLAKVDGLRVIADAAPADENLVVALGADQIVPPRTGNRSAHQTVVARRSSRSGRRGAWQAQTSFLRYATAVRSRCCCAEIAPTTTATWAGLTGLTCARFFSSRSTRMPSTSSSS